MTRPAEHAETDDDRVEKQGDGEHGDEAQPPLTLLQMLFSGVAALLGVQSSANRKRDFTRGKASHFIVLGIVFTVLFVLGMTAFVRLVLSTAG